MTPNNIKENQTEAATGTVAKEGEKTEVKEGE